MTTAPEAQTRPLRQVFEEQGYLDPLPVLAGDRLLAVREVVDRLLARVPAQRLNSTFELHNRHLDHPDLWTLVTDHTLVGVVREVFVPDLVLIGTRLVCKQPGAASTVPWHQDIPFMGLDPARTVTAWFAVDDADADNGALALVPGPAHREPRPHHKVRKGRRDGLLTDVECLDTTPEELRRAIRPPVPAGAAVLFGGGVLHGGASNASPRRRCALTIRFADGAGRPTDPGQWPAVVVRGDDGGRFGGRSRAQAAAYEESRRR